MSTFTRFDALMGRFYHHLGTVVGLSIGLFAVSISVDLFLRLFNLGNLPGVQEIIEYALFAGVFLSAPWVLRLGGHVRVDLLVSGLPSGAAVMLERFLNLFGLAICLVLLWFGSLNLQSAYAYNSLQMKYFKVPEWWLLTIFVISFSLLAIEFFSRLVRGGNANESQSEPAGGL